MKILKLSKAETDKYVDMELLRWLSRSKYVKFACLF